MLEPFGDLPFEDAVNGYTEAIAAGCPYSDIILMETFTDAYEAKAAVLAAKACCDLPVFISFSFGENGRLLTGLDARGVAAMFEGLGVSAIGANCGMGPDGMINVIKTLARSTRLPVFANPNAGLPGMEDGRAVYRLSPEGYAPMAASLFDAGAWMVGGCCGTTPDHIRALKKASAGHVTLPRPDGAARVITSSSASFDPDELINVSGVLDAKTNPSYRAVIGAIPSTGEEDAAESASELALDAVDEGADALRLNIGGANASFYRVLIPKLQTVLRVPLIFVDEDPNARAAASRVYNGHTAMI
jgi:5-methyltetrahydrofolate--homocysteine methyltransferase